ESQYGELLHTIESVVSHKLTQEALYTSEQKYRLLANQLAYQAKLFENISDAVISTDRDFNIVSWNKAAEETYGYKAEEVLGKNLRTVVPPEFISMTREEVLNQFFEKGYWQGETIQLRKDGAPLHILTSTTALKDESGKITGSIAVNRDITERVQLEKALRDSEERYRIVVENAGQAIVVAQDEKFVFVNPKTTEMLGYSKEELLSDSFIKFIHSDDKEMVTKRYLQRLSGKEVPTVYQIRVFTRNREIKWLEISVARIIWNTEPATLVFLNDITKQKEAEKILKFRLEVEHLLSEISTEFINISSDQIDDAINSTLKKINQFIGVNRSSLFLLSEDQRIITKTHEWCNSSEDSQIGQFQGIPFNTFGYYAKKLLNHEIVNITRLDDLPSGAREERERIQQLGHSSMLSIPLFQKNKLYGNLSIYGGVDQEVIWPEIFIDLLKFLGNIFVSSLERKKAEDELKRQKKELQIIFDSIPAFIFYKDKEGHYLQVNQEIVKSSGIPTEDWIGRKSHDLFPSDQAESYIQQDEEVLSSEEPKLKIIETMDSPEGLKWLQTDKIPYKNEDGEVVGLIGMSVDITELKRREQENIRLLQEVERSNKDLDEFASIVSHDLKAPLRGIKHLTELLMQDSAKKLDREWKEHLGLLVKQAHHMDKLIDGILLFSRIGRAQRKLEKIDLNSVLSEVINTLGPPNNIDITIQTELPTISTNRTEMIQLFSNLIENAIKFIDKPKGQIIINCEEKPKSLEFSVADNGPGIEERDFNKIFQMFQTLSSQDEVKGTGIGLAIVKKIVEVNGGRIWVESEVGVGSTFYFALPKGLYKYL
ncbi:MAG: PAS domain S-box protein, partial [Promethearchaeota archaeon]